MVGKLLGDRPQGTWMGITFAVGAIARIVGPFWAVQGYRFLGALVVFGGTAALYVLSLVCVKLVGETIRAGEEPPGPALAEVGVDSRASAREFVLAPAVTGLGGMGPVGAAGISTASQRRPPAIIFFFCLCEMMSGPATLCRCLCKGTAVSLAIVSFLESLPKLEAVLGRSGPLAHSGPIDGRSFSARSAPSSWRTYASW